MPTSLAKWEPQFTKTTPIPKHVFRTVLSIPEHDFAAVAMYVNCETTGSISTSSIVVGDLVSRPATFQSAAIQGAVIEDVYQTRFVAYEPAQPATSKSGDSNAPWTTPGGRTIGIHTSGDPASGSVSALRLDVKREYV